MAQESSTYEPEPGRETAWKGTSRYEVVGVLGEGGMGVVYEAFDREQGVHDPERWTAVWLPGVWGADS